MTSDRPVVSVIVPARNAARTLEAALRSLLNQTFRDFEIILIDDGSTDGTADAGDRLAAEDGRIRVVRRPRSGLALSLNAGIALARGEFVARQDADDVSLPGRFARQVQYLKDHPNVCGVGTAAEIINEAGQRIGPYPIRHGAAAVRDGVRTFRATPVHGSMVLRRDAIVAAGGYREAFEASQDSDLWLRLSEKGDLDNVEDVCYQWRLASGSVYAERREIQLRYAGLARMFAIERERFGEDSYADLERCRNLDTFAAGYRLRGPLYALWGELFLRGGLGAGAAFPHFQAAIARGEIRPRTLAGWAWTALGLPWPGGKPLQAPSSPDSLTHAP